ncbi:MAG: N-acetyl-gamma-glutamyl-phosphate reductase [Treponema sp.]|jgi:N-acetyl-gamma-glutamyl-phosphate reductase|nr:N-acetyl-gamma-glutamyl-phosphate reductase [Treponema sp.]
MIAGIIGATGYAGAELVRLLSRHPGVEETILASVSFGGERIEAVYPNFLGQVSAPLVKPEEAAAAADVVFSALPHGAGEPYAETALARGVPFIDLSADFRFGDDEETFRAWYGTPYRYPGLRRHSVYGLPELNRRRIRELAAARKVIVGNPGCYPTGASLGAYPALAGGLCGEGAIIVDAASGVTGGGREPQRSFHFPECADSMAPYKVGAHRHTPEIRRNFHAMSIAAMSVGGAGPAVIFTPHLAPMNRGILSTIYIPLRDGGGMDAADRDVVCRPPSARHEERAAEIRQRYAEFYRDEPFVRVLPAGVTAATGRVRLSNYCDISVHLDPSLSFLIVVSAIDNMMKGAAGQAVQNMNIIFGFDEKAGLEMVPALF